MANILNFITIGIRENYTYLCILSDGAIFSTLKVYIKFNSFNNDLPVRMASLSGNIAG